MNEAVLSVTLNMIGVVFLFQWRSRSHSVSLFVKAHMLLTMLCCRMVLKVCSMAYYFCVNVSGYGLI